MMHADRTVPMLVHLNALPIVKIIALVVVLHRAVHNVLIHARAIAAHLHAPIIVSVDVHRCAQDAQAAVVYVIQHAVLHVLDHALQIAIILV